MKFSKREKALKKLWNKKLFLKKDKPNQRLSPEDVIANALYHDKRMQDVTVEDGLWIIDVLQEFGYIIVDIKPDEHTD
jgi:hypothetical protein